MTPAPTNGNGKARERMILSHLPLARHIADSEHSRLPRWIDREEARSVAYLALVQAVDRWDSTRGVPLGFWVRKPIQGAVLDLGRRKAARLAWVPQREPVPANTIKGADVDEANDLPDPGPSPESLAAYEQFRSALWRRIDALPTRLRLVVRLRCCGGLGYPEIGRLMRVPVKGNTVEAWQYQARKLLRSDAESRIFGLLAPPAYSASRVRRNSPMPKPERKPWILQARKDGPNAGWIEVARYNGKPEAEREGLALGVGYRIAFDYAPVAIAEDETTNG